MARVNIQRRIYLATVEGSRFKNLVRTIQISPNFCVHRPVIKNKLRPELVALVSPTRTTACYTRWKTDLVLTHIGTGAKIHNITCPKADALQIAQELEAAYDWDFTDREKWDNLSKCKKSHLYSIARKLTP